MPQRSKNLLEAFNTSQKAEKHESASTSKGGAAARAGGPFAAGTSRAEKPGARPEAADAPPAKSAPPASSPSRAAKVVLPPIPQAFDSFLKSTLPLLVAVAAAAFLLGRASTRQVGAGLDDGPDLVNRDSSSPESSHAPQRAGEAGGAERTAGITPGASGQEPTPQGAPAAQPAAADTSSLFDARNKYTILAAQYSKGGGAKDLGWGAYAYLKEKGFAVFPLYDGAKKYQLFVGAEALQLHLDDVLADLRRIAGPSGTPGDFSTAMIVPIDLHVDR